MGEAETTRGLVTTLSTMALSLGAMLSILCLFLAVDHLRGQRVAEARLSRFGLLTDDEAEAGGAARTGSDLLRELGAWLAQRATPRHLQRLRAQLVRGGLADRLTVEEFLGLGVLTTFGGVALGGILAVPLALLVESGSPGGGLVAALIALGVGGALGYFLPSLVLQQMIDRRRNEIERQLPNAVDVLSVSLEAGLGFDSAVGFLCERANNALVVELRRYLADLRLGRTRREALDGLVDRTQSPVLREFAAAVIQADELGTGLVRTLRTQAGALRASRRVRAEEQARKAPIKLLFPIVVFILPVLFIVIIGPALLQALSVFGE